MPALRVLIVDDHDMVRRGLSVFLKSFEDLELVGEARNGEEAVEMVKQTRPDVVIMDIMMPGGMDGFEATRALKNDPETKDCTIIILTAKGQKADREKGVDAGADHYFVKPFSPLELIKKTEEVLGY